MKKTICKSRIIYEKKDVNYSFVNCGKYNIHVNKEDSKKLWNKTKQFFQRNEISEIFKIVLMKSYNQKSDMISLYLPKSLPEMKIQSIGEKILKILKPQPLKKCNIIQKKLKFKDLHGYTIVEINF